MADQPGTQTLELYKTCVEEEHYFLSEHHKRIAFYTGLLSAILALTIGGFLKAETWYHFGVLILGGFLMVGISSIAKSGTQRLYQLFLEAITTRAKLEEDLGFSEERGKPEKGWPMAEHYIPKRHLDSQSNQEGKTSWDWVKAHLEEKENYHGISTKLFTGALWVGIALMVIAVALACIQSNVI
ncbi:MAG: hypothetical protein WBD64_08500 [Candidatus Zixiibacteriota bacterium]